MFMPCHNNREFVNDGRVYPNLTFEGKAGAYPSRHLTQLDSKVGSNHCLQLSN
jgi:hypothetical protein